MNVLDLHPSREELAAFLLGQLDAAGQSAVEQHVEECDACCQVLRQIPDDTLLGRLRHSNTMSEAAPGPSPTVGRDPQNLPRELREHPRYQIVKFLGSGGMGMVYKAEHRLMERPVALKIIHRDLTRNAQAVERFRQEVKAAARLAHPNIVTAHDAEQAGDVHFLVMEFVDGISLARLIAKRGPLPVTHACHFVRQVALGLQHAFEKGMVHRDIKPHNLMLTRQGQVKILDFGLARLASEPHVAAADSTGQAPADLTTAGMVVGTPDYIAPEQALDSRRADIRADIYSLGCTLYYLLVGKTPFDQGSVMTKLLGHMYQPPQPIVERRDDLPADVTAIIEKMMAKDPAERYQTPAEVAAALAGPARIGVGRVDEMVSRVEPETPPSAPATRPEPTASGASARPSTTRLNNPVLFVARCPFCAAKLRVVEKALGFSVPCPECGSYFTAVPEEDESSVYGTLAKGPLDSHPSRASLHAEIPTVRNFPLTRAEAAPGPEEVRRDSARRPAPWGPLALVLACLSLLFASFPFFRTFAIPLSLIAITLTLAGLVLRSRD